ncbi:MAG: dihydroorotate dehydrogenase [Bacteroidota bacterium]
MKKIETKIGKLILKSPIMTCSGTSGSSGEINVLKNNKKVLNSLGAFVTKGVTLNAKAGNKEPRIVETRCGILNSIGLQNKGVVNFINKELPKLTNYNLPVIVNISAPSVSEFGKLTAKLLELDVNSLISGIEINVSCPNIESGGLAFGTNPKLVEKIVKTVKKNTNDRITIITKLTPNITDITETAKAAIYGGTDALSMINTLKGMAINIDTMKPFLGNIAGGLSGPAIKPIGVFMVYNCFQNINECKNHDIPIIGMGGITNFIDALEYIMAGASAVAVGTEWFVNNNVFVEIFEGIKKYLAENNMDFNELIGIAQTSRQ